MKLNRGDKLFLTIALFITWTFTIMCFGVQVGAFRWAGWDSMLTLWTIVGLILSILFLGALLFSEEER